MALETIRSPISLSDYITLSDHQETTPASFYDGKPVLYYHATGAKAWLHKSKRGKLPFFPADLENEPTAPENGAVSAANEKVEQVVDVFVNSAYGFLPCQLTLSPKLGFPREDANSRP